MKLAKSLDSMVTIKKADKEVDASRLLSLMGLGVRCNDEVMVRIEGGNEDAAYDDMKQYFEADLRDRGCRTKTEIELLPVK